MSETLKSNPGGYKGEVEDSARVANDSPRRRTRSATAQAEQAELRPSSRSTFGLSVGDNARSLIFGTIVGGGSVAGLAALAPDLIPDKLTHRDLYLIGSFVGSLTHQLIDSVFLKGILRPMGRMVTYYGLFVQLVLLEKRIGRKQAAALRRELTDRYFLGKSLSGP